MTLDPGAFELRRQDGSLVELNVAASVVNGRTVAVLTFAGPDIVGGSLADGNYTLTIRGDRVHDAVGRELDGDGDGIGGRRPRRRLLPAVRRQRRRPRRGPARPGRFLEHVRPPARRPALPGVLGRQRRRPGGLIDLVAFARRLGTHLDP